MSRVHTDRRCGDRKDHQAQEWALRAGLTAFGPNGVKLNYAVDSEGHGYWWKVMRCRCILVAFHVEVEGNPPGGGAPVGAGSGKRNDAGDVTEVQP
jgi:hypothetical protein